MGMYRVEALVLRTREFGEADRLVTLYSRERGKVRAVARGSRRPRNRLCALTQSYTHGRFLMFSGKNLDTISQCEVVNTHQRLREDLLRTSCAACCAELTSGLVGEEDPAAEVFDLLNSTFALLAAVPDDPTRLVYAFSLRLLALLGYRPSLAACVRCGAEPPYDGGPVFSAASGGLLCPRCRGEAGDAVTIAAGTWRALLQLERMPLERIPRLKLDGVTDQEIDRCLEEYAVYRLERPFRSLHFLRQVRGITPV